MAQVTVNTPNREGAIDEQFELAVSPSKEKVKIDGEEIAGGESEIRVAEVVIRTGADAAEHLLPLRDDFDPAGYFSQYRPGHGSFGVSVGDEPNLRRQFTFLAYLRLLQTVMLEMVINSKQQFKPTSITISGTFIVLISYFVGNAWAKLLPRGEKFEARWRDKNGQGKHPLWISASSLSIMALGV